MLKIAGGLFLGFVFICFALFAIVDSYQYSQEKHIQPIVEQRIIQKVNEQISFPNRIPDYDPQTEIKPELTNDGANKECQKAILVQLKNPAQYEFTDDNFNMLHLYGTRWAITTSIKYISQKGKKMDGIFACKIKYDDHWDVSFTMQNTYASFA